MTETAEPTLDQVLAEPTLDFEEFTNESAVRLGESVLAAIRDNHADLAVRVVVNGDIVFQAKLGSTGPGNDEWLRGKALAAEQTGEASILSRLRPVAAGTPLTLADYYTGDGPKPFGGSFPIKVNGVVVGTVTASGEADHVDHQVVAEGIRNFMNSR